VLVWPAIVYGLVAKASPIQPDVANAAARAGLAVGPIAAWALAGFVFLRQFAPECGGTVTAVVRTHAPLFRLFGGVVFVLGMAMVVAGRPYALILLHVSVWYVFSCYMFSKRAPAKPLKGLWSWMRTTGAGFRVLHIGMALLLIAVGLVWTYAFGAGGWLWYLLSPESFLYWTIMHITVSFVPR
ncbi:MAG: hypothetical protein V3T70_00630, partial [Phycisphaerae bacterium]